MKTNCLLLAASLAVALLPASALHAGTIGGAVINPANNHRYFLLTASSWTAARDEAAAFGGDLVVINDAAEEAWVWNTFGNLGGTPRNLWIGLRRLVSGGPFLWVDGTPLGYTNWLPGEPNNDGGLENHALIYAYPHLPEGTVGGWNDVPVNGYPGLPQLAEIHGVVEAAGTVFHLGAPGDDPGTFVIAEGDLRYEGGALIVAPGDTLLIQGTHSFASVKSDYGEKVIFDSTNVYVGTLQPGNYEVTGGSILRAGDILLTDFSRLALLSVWGVGGVPPGGAGGTIIANNVTISANSRITGTGLGFPGGYDAWGIGPGTNAGYDKTGAGSHGGQGLLGGPTYGSSMQPTTIGSSGNGKYVDGWSSGTGGNGGSAVHLQVSGTLTLDGLIEMDGANGIDKAGGGAGGSVWIETATLTGSGCITACGGSAMNNAGGGRVAVYANNSSGFTGFTDCSVAGGRDLPQAGGQAGTLAFFDTSGGTNHYKLWVPQERFAGDPTSPLVLSEILVGGALSTDPLLDLSPTAAVQAGKVTVNAGKLQLGEGSLTQVSGDFTVANGTLACLGGGGTLEVAGTLGLRGTNSTLLVQGKNVSGMVADQWVGEGGTLRATFLEIEAGAKLSANGQGYVGSNNAYGMGPGALGKVGGGGHGGSGGAGGGPAYGDGLQPLTPGSAGGGVYVDGWSAGTGGSGGGAIHLIVSNTLTLAGEITANGLDASVGKAGGGAGGSLWIETGSLTGSGLLSASGGLGDGGYGGGGGGGRIAVHYASAAGFTAWTQASTAAGLTPQPGQHGTLLFVDTSLGAGHPQWLVPAYRYAFSSTPLWLESLTIGLAGATTAASVEVAPGVTLLSGQLTVRAAAQLLLGGGATLEITGTFSLLGTNTTVQAACRNLAGPVDGEWVGEGVLIQAGDLVLGSGASLTANGQGYYGAYNQLGNGPGAGGDASGGSHGGSGGSGGPTYGLWETPGCPGSAGDGGQWRSQQGMWDGVGGSGGGTIHLRVAGSTTLEGVISANGGDGWATAGGGSGGSLWLETGTLAGAGAMSANGGNGANGCGSGGGGRIAVHYTNASAFTGWASASTQAGQTPTPGQDGTLLFVDTSLGAARPQWLVPAYRCAFTSTPRSFESLTIGLDGAPVASMEVAPGVIVRGGQLSARAAGQIWLAGGANLEIAGTLSMLGTNTTLHAACRNLAAPVWGDWSGQGVFIQAGNLVIGSGAGMTADGQGYSADWQSPGRGPGGGGGARGGSYGGSGASGGPTYGFLETPISPGSAGGGGTWRPYQGVFYGNGGSGGGAIHLLVPGAVTLDGAISANGGNGWGQVGGGGAGGSLWLEVGTLAGTGALSANGANGTDAGGGGGGRIAIYASQMSGFDPAHITVTGGAAGGSNGTIYTSGAAVAPQVIAQSPASTANGWVHFIDLTFSTPLNEASFTLDDIVFTTPTGPLAASQLTLTRTGGITWRLGFPGQTANGNYALTVGPAITSWLGVAVPAYNSTFTLNVPRTLTQTLTGTNLQLSCPTVTGLNYQLQGS
ncbi:MAG: C-type lectin domain-containing protein, partial [Verrucomicrobia bacterium]|nr:C-type lectin domain-containing protein [Verrucomicrobiota bacterium]